LVILRFYQAGAVAHRKDHGNNEGKIIDISPPSGELFVECGRSGSGGNESPGLGRERSHHHIARRGNPLGLSRFFESVQIVAAGLAENTEQPE
jgi:hypothetical protein